LKALDREASLPYPVRIAIASMQLVAHGVPLAPGQDRKLAGAEPHRVKALGLQPARTLKDEVELGRVRAIDHEPPGRAQVGQAVHAAVHPQPGQQLGHRVAGRIVEQLHRSLRFERMDKRIVLTNIAIDLRSRNPRARQFTAERR
jgi:hypothetical protein